MHLVSWHVAAILHVFPARCIVMIEPSRVHTPTIPNRQWPSTLFSVLVSVSVVYQCCALCSGSFFADCRPAAHDGNRAIKRRAHGRAIVDIHIQSARCTRKARVPMTIPTSGGADGAAHANRLVEPRLHLRLRPLSRPSGEVGGEGEVGEVANEVGEVARTSVRSVARSARSPGRSARSARSAWLAAGDLWTAARAPLARRPGDARAPPRRRSGAALAAVARAARAPLVLRSRSGAAHGRLRFVRTTVRERRRACSVPLAQASRLGCTTCRIGGARRRVNADAGRRGGRECLIGGHIPWISTAQRPKEVVNKRASRSGFV